MLKSDKERIVAELTEQLRTTETLLVADYRGLTMKDMEGLRDELIKHGARLQVVKNTLTRRAAEAAGSEALLALLEGPTAIAFLETDGDPAAVAKALSEAARTTRVLEIKGGILGGATISDADVESLAKLPSAEVLRGQVLAAVIAPLTALVSLVSAPLRDFVGLLDARAEQLREEGGAEEEPSPEAERETAAEAPPAEAETPDDGEPAAESEPASEAEPAAEAAPAAEETPEPESELPAEPEPAAEAEPAAAEETDQPEGENTEVEEDQ